MKQKIALLGYGAIGKAVHRLLLSHAGQVEVVGSFSGWEPIALRPVGEGRWSTGPLRLQSGVYTYVFLVDGLPTLPSEVTHREPDGLGGENGVLLVDGLPSTLAPPPSPGPAGAPPR